MAELIYSTTTSLDGCINDADGEFDWSAPSEEVHAFVDECALFVVPHIVGGGTRALPDGVRLALELRDERRFASGVVFLRYAVRN